MQSALAKPLDADDLTDTSVRPRILVVDDIADNRSILARRFRRRGFDVVEAASGGEALKQVDAQCFDLVLLDVMMPDLSGIEVLRLIRQRHSPVALPVIMVTAKSQSEDVVEALELGANDYVTKPVDFAVAFARARTQIGRKQAESEVRTANAALSKANDDLEQRIAERTERLVSANDKLQREIAQRLKSESEIHHLAHHDSLTGLGNRLQLHKDLDETLARVRRSGETLAVLFLDLDGFKGINDTLGHSIGDGLLKSVAAKLRENLRENDKVARLGGDEFAVVQVSSSQPADAADLASRLIGLLSTPCSIDGHHVVIGCSVGIVVARGDDADREQLLRRADLAMYRAKADGRGTFRFFEPEMDERAQSRRHLELELRKSLSKGNFELHYQPLFDLRRNTVTSFEALLRWRRPDGLLTAPTDFIPLAEETGLIVQLGEWALRQACRDAASWSGDISVAVNLSPVQFRNGRLVPTVIQALANSGLNANRLELEVTESVLLEKSDVNLATLRQLRNLGIRLAMDDFGTGYSSLGYLKSFLFDKIKIDRSFVKDFTEQKDSMAIVRAIAVLGNSLGMTTTAEGVETLEQLDCLRSEGFAEAQGYLFSQPRPAAEVPRMSLAGSDLEHDLADPKEQLPEG